MKAEQLGQALSGLLWSVVGAFVMAFIFTSAFLTTFTPIPMDAFNAIALGPLLIGFMVGALLTDLDIRGVEYAAILTAGLGMAIIYFMMLVPMFTGTAESILDLPTTDASRQAMILSSVFLIPLTMMGAILGKAFGEFALPSEVEVARRHEILQEAREWHALLRAMQEKGVSRVMGEEE